ncbi:unnamed protein product [Moneuplotes crassus]|uniref:Uncharacterized protein n=1 Tax=Euplotes crassus TaxID=5936 RepID=A0AAD1XL72_EUPCR|nr:unnamed protein product [Moneuplotes crassus]
MIVSCCSSRSIILALKDSRSTEDSKIYLRVIKRTNEILRSLKTDDIPGAFRKKINIQNPKDIMTIDDIPGAKPSKFRHRGFDKKKLINNAKYKNIFDKFGSRKLENTINISGIRDPLAASRERRKNMFKLSKMSDSAYAPRNLGCLRLSRRYYKGISKNQSHMSEIMREARNEANTSLLSTHSMTLPPHAPIHHSSMEVQFPSQANICNTLARSPSLLPQTFSQYKIDQKSPSQLSNSPNPQLKFAQRFSVMTNKFDATSRNCWSEETLLGIITLIFIFKEK